MFTKTRKVNCTLELSWMIGIILFRCNRSYDISMQLSAATCAGVRQR